MNKPLVILAGIILSGIVFAKYMTMDFLTCYLLSAIFLLASVVLFSRNESVILILFSLFFVSGALFANSNLSAKCDIVNFISGNNQRCLVLGQVISHPRKIHDYSEFIFKAREIDFASLRHNCCGNILVKVKSIRYFYPGQNLILAGSLRKPYLKFNGSSNNYLKYLKSRDIFSFMEVGSDSEAVKLDNKNVFKNGFFYWIKIYFQSLINSNSKGPQAAVLEAMVLGGKENLPKKLIDSMILTGTIHILVVSGFNVGIICFVTSIMLKIIRLPRKIRLVITAIAAAFYCLVTGSSIPVFRATVMAEIFILSYFFKSEADIYNCLGLAAIIILMLNPRQLFDVGFELSFISVFSIVYFYPKLKKSLNLDKIKFGPILFLADGLIVSFSAWLGTMWIIAYNFRIFSPITIIANIFIVPLASLITLCGFGIIIFGEILPFLAGLFALNAKALIGVLFTINNLLAKIPGAYYKF